MRLKRVFGEGGNRKEDDEHDGEDNGAVESMYHMRLMTLLQELV